MKLNPEGDPPGWGENFEAEAPVNLDQWPHGAKTKVFFHHSEAVLRALAIHKLVVLYHEPASVT